MASLPRLSRALLIVGLFAGTAAAQSSPVLFKNATIVDGMGKMSYRGDVRIQDGRITRIGSIKALKDDEPIDASGLILAPGFIDIHNHSES